MAFRASWTKIQSTMDDVVPITICYEDLAAFEDNSSSNSLRLIEQIGKAFGPCGLGIVLISGVPHFTEYRNALLPLAAQIPRLPPHVLDQCIHAESLYAVGWSHGKEELVSGQPDTSKGSYYANPLTNDLWASIEARDGCSGNAIATGTDTSNSNGSMTDDVFNNQQQRQQAAQDHPEFFAANVWPPPPSLPQLEPAFCRMGRLLHSVGCRVASVCDAYCRQVQSSSDSGSDMVQTTINIASTIQQSLNATGRLLHYFAVETTPNTGTNDVESTLQQQKQPQQPDNMHAWCAWHKDHSALTGLVPGMYLDAQTMQPVVDGPSHIDSQSGLYIQTRTTGQLVRIVIPPDHCAFQIGETSQILSGGLLQATPHAVLTNNRRTATTAVKDETSAAVVTTTRESFALFMEPEFDFVLDVPSGRTVDDCEGQVNAALGLRSIRERYQPGMTYGEFHLATISAFAVKD